MFSRNRHSWSLQSIRLPGPSEAEEGRRAGFWVETKRAGCLQAHPFGPVQPAFLLLLPGFPFLPWGAGVDPPTGAALWVWASSPAWAAGTSLR